VLQFLVLVCASCMLISELRLQMTAAGWGRPLQAGRPVEYSVGDKGWCGHRKLAFKIKQGRQATSDKRLRGEALPRYTCRTPHPCVSPYALGKQPDPVAGGSRWYEARGGWQIADVVGLTSHVQLAAREPYA
jgi:hypothetical protein